MHFSLKSENACHGDSYLLLVTICPKFDPQNHINEIKHFG